MQRTSLGAKLPRKRRLSGALLSFVVSTQYHPAPLRRRMRKVDSRWLELNGGYPDVTVELYHR